MPKRKNKNQLKTWLIGGAVVVVLIIIAILIQGTSDSSLKTFVAGPSNPSETDASVPGGPDQANEQTQVVGGACYGVQYTPGEPTAARKCFQASSFQKCALQDARHAVLQQGKTCLENRCSSGEAFHPFVFSNPSNSGKTCTELAEDRMPAKAENEDEGNCKLVGVQSEPSLDGTTCRTLFDCNCSPVSWFKEA